MQPDTPSPDEAQADNPVTVPQSPGGGTDWANVIDNIDQQKTQAVTQNMAIAQTVNPETAASAQRLSPVLGVPAATIEADPNFWQQQFDTRASSAAISTDDNLKTWLASNVNNAKIAQGDVPHLGMIGTLFNSMQQGWQQQKLESQLGYLGATEGTTGLSPQQQDLGESLREQLSNLGPAPSGAAGAVGSFVGSTARMIGSALPEAAVGAAAGALAGLPEGGVGAIPGAIAGAARGLSIGIAGQQGIQSYGQTYDALSSLHDKNGNPIPEATRQAASVITGVGTAALATVGGEELSAPVRNAAGQLINRVAIEAATRPTLSRALNAFATSAVKAGVTGALVNGGMTAIQTIMPDAAKAISSPDFATVFNDPAQQAALVHNIVSSMEQGAIAFPLAEMPLRGVALWADMARAHAATENVNAWSAVQDAAAASKTRVRNPDAFANLMSLHAQDGAAESVFVPADRMSEMYQSLKTEPGAPEDPFAFVPDMKEQMDQGLLTGGDIEIPTAEFTAHLAGTDIEKALRQDMRFAEDGMTLRESLELQNHPAFQDVDPGMATDLEQHLEQVHQEQEQRDTIHTSALDMLGKAGFSSRVAENYATLIAERYMTRGQRLGTSPLELYQSENLQIKRENQRLGQIPYTGLDEVIDTVRNGTKQPSDRQLFGPSLLEHLASTGGVRDNADELHSMDADKWHVGKPGQKKLVAAEGQNLDDAALHSWEAGYFPELSERPSINEFLEAVRSELSGQKRYKQPDADAVTASQKRDAANELSALLDKHGIDPKTTTNDQIKAAIEAEKVAPTTYEQEGARGSITFGQDEHTIRLFKDADLSTLLHELGHQFLDEIFRDADREDAPQDLRDDAATIRKSLGLKDGEAPSIEHHEQWAKMFETYLMEGKAPSIELKSAFQKFASWLTRIYKTLAGIGAPVSDSVRGVMDRLLATDDAIQEAREGLAIRNPVWRSAKDAGMTEGVFKRYTDLIRKAATDAFDRTLNRAMAAERKKATAEFKAEADRVRPEMRAQVVSRPVLRAWHYLAKGRDPVDPEQPMLEAKLDQAAVQHMLGEGAKRLPQGLTEANGTHPDIVASMFGYESGEAMLRDIISENMGRTEAVAQSGRNITLDGWMDKLTEQAVNDHVLSTHGDPLLDGTIEEAAMAAAHNAAQLDVFATELRQLAKQNGDMPSFTMQEAMRWARNSIAQMPIKRAIGVAAFRRAEGQAGRDTERALLADKPVDAFKAKQRQILAHLMAKEAQRLSDMYDSTIKTWKKIGTSPTRKGTASAFMAQAHGALQRLGINVHRDPGELDRALGGVTLENFVFSQRDQGYQMLVPGFMVDPMFSKNYRDLTAEQFQQARDAITSIMKSGRDSEEVTIGERRVALQDEIDAAVDMMLGKPLVGASARANPGAARDLEGRLYTIASGLRALDASLVKVEQFFQDLGSTTSLTNPFLRIFDRLKRAQHDENDRREVLAAQWREMKAGLADNWAKTLQDRVSVPELTDPRTGRAMDMSRGEMISLMLNMGNDSNFDKLTRGYGWDREAVIGAVSRLASKDDIAFVNGVHNIFRGLFPDIDAMHRRVTGVGMPRFDDTPHSLMNGDILGGYFPVVYDSSRAKVEPSRLNPDGVFDSHYRFASTPKGHTIERTNFAGAIQLGLDRIPYLLCQQVHDLTHREAIMDANKFLGHPTIVGLLKDKAGPEYQRIMTPWLQHIANNSNTDDKMLDWWNRGLAKARIATSAVGIGFRIGTLLKHGGSALVNSVSEVGGKSLLGASRDLYGPSGAQFRDFVMKNSGELRHRFDTFDRDARANFKSLIGEASWIAQVERFSYMPVAAADMGSAMPTWLAAYRNSMADGADHDAAVAEGDRAVRNAHGSGGAADLAQIQRGGELFKMFTMFYGFFNHMYNRGVRQIAKQTASGVRNIAAGNTASAYHDFTGALGRSFWYLVMPALIEQTVSGGLKQAMNDPNQNWFEWGASAILGQAAASIPILRDIAAHELQGYQYEPSPLTQAVTTVGGSINDLERWVGLSDKPVSSKALEHAIQSVGYLTGLPTGQIGTTAQYLWDVGDGQISPDNVKDFLTGVMRGPPPRGQQ